MCYVNIRLRFVNGNFHVSTGAIHFYEPGPPRVIDFFPSLRRVTCRLF